MLKFCKALLSNISHAGTVKENILMGAEYDQQFYQEVVEACGLIQDFTQFIHGDETIVGDRGVQCSGGQKARYVERSLIFEMMKTINLIPCPLFQDRLSSCSLY